MPSIAAGRADRKRRGHLGVATDLRASRESIDISMEDCKSVEAAMTKCSAWLRGHYQAAAARAPVPNSAELKADIDAFRLKAG